MPNDDLGTFPMPPQTSDTPSVGTAPEPVAQPPVPPTDAPAPVPVAETTTPVAESTFEPTPEEIPSVQSTPTPSPDLISEQEKIVAANETLIEKQNVAETPVEEPQPQPQPEPVAQPTETPAATPPKTSRSIAPIIIVVLVIVSGIGLAAAAFLSQQTKALKTQLTEITQTLEKQQTTLTPTATPTVFEIPTPSSSPSATPTIISTPSATPTISIINKLLPLGNASSALKIAVNHSPNAQLILIKVDNASDENTAVTKYFFRESLTTKKYFYVAITGTGNPELIDKQIYVTPDDNIPSLNDAVLSNKMGTELGDILKITYTLCTNQSVCTSAPVKAQYIKTGTGIIWQVSVYTNGLSANPLIAQINAETKVILYKSPEFANK